MFVSLLKQNLHKLQIAQISLEGFSYHWGNFRCELAWDLQPVEACQELLQITRKIHENPCISYDFIIDTLEFAWKKQMAFTLSGF